MKSFEDFLPAFFSNPLPATVVGLLWTALAGCTVGAWVVFYRVTEWDQSWGKRALLNFSGLLGVMGTVASVLPLICTSWIDDTEFGISRTQTYQTGAYLAPLEPIEQVPRVGEFMLVDADGVGSVKIRWLVVEPEKLSAIYGDLTGLGARSSAESQVSSSDPLSRWIESKLLPLNTTARELFQIKGESATDLPGDKFLSSVESILKPYGIEVTVFVKLEYVLKAPGEANAVAK